MKLLLAILSCCCVWSAVLAQARNKCSIAVPSDIASNPVLLELYKSRASANLLAALRAGLLKPAQKYWNETVCLESETSATQAALQHIIRDYISFYAKPGSSYPTYYHNFRAVLDFLEATNQPEPVYSFLINEMRENDLILEDDLIFDTVLTVKDQFGLGQDSALLRGLPKAVQQIALQGKQIRLKNNVTGKYLVLNANNEYVTNGLNFFTLSDQAINAAVNVSNSASAPTWDFKPVKMPSRGTPLYGRNIDMYAFELYQHAPCTSPGKDCSSSTGQMLTVRGFARQQGYDPEQYRGGQRFVSSSFSKFSFNVHGDDVVSIELQLDRVYEKHVLAELPDGSVGVVIRGNTAIDGQPIAGMKSYWTVEV